MRDTYTITRWDNGWSVDIKTGEGLKDYSGISEDPYWVDDKRLSRAQSLADLLVQAFDKYIASEDEYGMIIEVDEAELEETTKEGEEDDCTG